VSAGTQYYHQDHLSNRLITDTSGAKVSEQGHFPYGELWYPSTPATKFVFTGKERDSESGLDNFGARYDSSQYGRFMTPDEPLLWSDKENPQSWNLYSYVQNNPLNRIDPTGRLTIIVPGTGWSSNDWNENMKLISDAKEEFHDSDVRILGWSGSLGGDSISGGAQMLEGVVNSHTFGSDEKLNIIAHSRGGDVALAASGSLNHKIDNLVTLGTPKDCDSCSFTNIGDWLNVTAKQDLVQFLASTGRDPRNFPGAHNFTLNAQGFGPVSAHSALWQSDWIRDVWWQKWLETSNCQEGWNGSTNTLSACP
jgi:RHS repeat-associated protein